MCTHFLLASARTGRTERRFFRYRCWQTVGLGTYLCRRHWRRKKLDSFNLFMSTRARFISNQVILSRQLYILTATCNELAAFSIPRKPFNQLSRSIFPSHRGPSTRHLSRYRTSIQDLCAPNFIPATRGYLDASLVRFSLYPIRVQNFHCAYTFNMADTEPNPSTVDKAVDKVTDAFKDLKSHMPTSSNPDSEVPQSGKI